MVDVVRHMASVFLTIFQFLFAVIAVVVVTSDEAFSNLLAHHIGFMLCKQYLNNMLNMFKYYLFM